MNLTVGLPPGHGEVFRTGTVTASICDFRLFVGMAGRGGLPSLGVSGQQTSMRNKNQSSSFRAQRQASFKVERQESLGPGQLERLRRKAAGEAENANQFGGIARFQEEMAERGGAGLFRRGLEGWVKDGLMLQAYAKEKEATVNSYVPITAGDLKASGTKDWESARRVVSDLASRIAPKVVVRIRYHSILILKRN